MADTLENLSGPDLIDRAAASGDDAMRDAALGRISDKASAVKRTIDAGVSPAEYKRLEIVHSSLVTSGNVVATACKIAKTNQTKG